jgi:hypothetical protein
VLNNWLDRYYTSSRLEATGRTFEIIGIRLFYAWITNIFKEPLFPSVSRIEQDQTPTPLPVSPETLQHTVQVTRYHELINLIYSTATLPLVLLSLLLGHFWLCVLGALIFIVHLLFTLQERYKRVLCLLLLSRPNQTFENPVQNTAPEQSETPKTLSTRIADVWFSPFAFETTRFYRLLGVEWFRQQLLQTAESAFLDKDQRAKGEKHSHIRGGSEEHFLRYIQQTRTSEVIHLVGVCQHIPFLYVFVMERLFPASAYVLLFQWVNTWCILLQRYHRVRIETLLRRYRRKR